MARPRIRAVIESVIFREKEKKKGKNALLTVNITLSLICLGYEQIGDVSSNMVLVTCGVTAKDLLESRVTRQHLTKKPLDRRDTYTRAFTSARSQFCRLTIEIISGTALPSSFSRATCVAARVP